MKTNSPLQSLCFLLLLEIHQRNEAQCAEKNVFYFFLCTVCFSTNFNDCYFFMIQINFFFYLLCQHNFYSSNCFQDIRDHNWTYKGSKLDHNPKFRIFIFCLILMGFHMLFLAAFCTQIWPSCYGFRKEKG